MATAVYLVCALASIACAVLLAKSWIRSRVRLLMWTALGFAGLAVNNILLFTDRVLVPERDLGVARDITGFAGIAILLFGLIWESR
jgi:hypothetical protein